MNELKLKVSTEFCLLLKKIKKGYKPDYEFIMLELSLLELMSDLCFDNSTILMQYYLNNKWQME